MLYFFETVKTISEPFTEENSKVEMNITTKAMCTA